MADFSRKTPDVTAGRQLYYSQQQRAETYEKAKDDIMTTLATAATKYGATEWEINPALLLLKHPNTNETIADTIFTHDESAKQEARIPVVVIADRII